MDEIKRMADLPATAKTMQIPDGLIAALPDGRIFAFRGSGLTVEELKAHDIAAALKAQEAADTIRNVELFRSQIKNGLRELKVLLEEGDEDGAMAYINGLLGDQE